MKRKSGNDKMIGIAIGIAIAVSAIGIINLISISSAHRSMDGMMGNMMNNDMMHLMMMGGQNTIGDSNSMMNCMSMMKNYGMTQQEIENMLKSMDKDSDGQCDMCGMSVEVCRRMMG